MSAPSFVIARAENRRRSRGGNLIGFSKGISHRLRGYYAEPKDRDDGKRYQLQIQLVEIGSKKAAEFAASAEND